VASPDNVIPHKFSLGSSDYDISLDQERPSSKEKHDVKRFFASIFNPFYLFKMEMVTLSSIYQVVIPRSVRVSLGLRPGIKLQVIATTVAWSSCQCANRPNFEAF
jgi:hypothetical protein